MFTKLQELICYAPEDDAPGGGAEGERDENPNPNPEEGEGDEGEQPNEVSVAASDAKVKAEMTRVANAEGIDGEVSTFEELQAKREEKRMQQRQVQTDTRAALDVAKRVGSVKEGLNKLVFNAHDDKGQPIEIKLSPEQIATYTKDIESLVTPDGETKTLRDHYVEEVYTDLSGAAGAVLPNELHAAFNKATTLHDEKTGQPILDNDGNSIPKYDLNGWLNELVEHAAPRTKWAKQAALDSAAAIAAAKEEGFQLGQGAPDGTPDKRGERGGSGPLTKVRVAAMSMEEAAEAWATRPAEMAAIQ